MIDTEIHPALIADYPVEEALSQFIVAIGNIKTMLHGSRKHPSQPLKPALAGDNANILPRLPLNP